jgi:hypothetical protein
VLFLCGLIGFLAPVAMIFAPPYLLYRLELPSPEQRTIAHPDGTRFVLSLLSRVQRYDREGRFELGWFTPTGGSGDIGLTSSGDVLICAKSRLMSYATDGSNMRELGRCVSSGTGHIERPESLAGPPGGLAAVRQGLLPWLLVPLWHPALAWLMIVVGGAVLMPVGLPETERRR